MITATLIISLVIILIGIVSVAVRGKKTLPEENIVKNQKIDFQYPEDDKNLWNGKWISTIEKVEKWDWNEIRKFWFDTEQIGVTLLEEKNDSLIFDLFDKYK